MYCGDERLQKWVKDYRSDLASFCDFEWRNNDEAVMTETGEDMRSPGDDWRFWIDAETRRRTGYSVWVCVLSSSLGVINQKNAALGLYVGISFPNAASIIFGECYRQYSLSRSSLGG